MTDPDLKVYSQIYEIRSDDEQDILDTILSENFRTFLKYGKDGGEDTMIFNLFFLENPPPNFETQYFSYVVGLKRKDLDLHVDMTFHEGIDDILPNAVYNLLTGRDTDEDEFSGEIWEES